MRKTETGTAFTRHRLPAVADDSSLIPAADELLAAGGNIGLTLDFGDTAHIDYRALRRFIRQVRRIGPLSRPIDLVGLNPYCAAIVHFTLTTSDWEMFAGLVPDMETGASWGMDAPSSLADSGLVRQGPGVGASLFLVPCPN